MTMPLTLYGQGKCGVCGCTIRRGLLMCGPHWANVPDSVKRQVYRALDDWDHNVGTLGDLQNAQEAAIHAAQT